MAAGSWGKSWGKSWGAAWGTVVQSQPPEPAPDADHFNYRSSLNHPPGRYAADPIIARMGQRMTRRNRW